jgi:NADH:ubiquinone oxidoreductase subunit F (NADH-binding)/(2Fe-2S) ferredoxin/NAD-dependent dihydropyrimidine dehydrogenase PreA subunit
MKLNTVKELEEYRRSVMAKADPKRKWVSLCVGTGCIATGADKVSAAFKAEVQKGNLKGVEVKETGCPGFCERGPLLTIHPDGIFYQNVKPEHVPDIIEKTIRRGEIIEELLYTDPMTGKQYEKESEVPFYAKQTRLILGNNPLVDATRIDDYIANGGYAAIAKVLGGMTPQEVIDEVKKAGLRGRGGAGFPAGVKWETTRKAVSPDGTKYVVCNADEGDPGAFMNRSVLEGNPHCVLEGMMIGAYAIGATEGYAYVRAEYPLAVKNVTLAVKQARELGLLGHNILGTSFSFDIHIVQGAGAFVCGEETALMASIEGRRGMPRPRPPFPSVSGIWGKPTNINNVETWANAPLIINKGADWYQTIGSKTSKGTKIFALVGKIKNTGLVEVPLGTSLREVVYGIGGGIPDGKKLKAVQCGGPSGGCIAESNIDVPVDYEGLKQYGAMMGSGGMVVMDEDTCMVDVAHYFLGFTQFESCGKCPPCRIGTRKMRGMIARIIEGKGEEGDIEKLEKLAVTIQKGSLCALGGTVPNPVLTTLRYFKDEYVAHVRDKRCPARVCKPLIWYEIDDKTCIGCQLCAKKCPAAAITGEKKKAHVIDRDKCIRCGVCSQVCPKKSVDRKTRPAPGGG